jgi:two-component system nitrogen regulation response regulator NtrX
MPSKYQILIVEDEARWREDILREALEEAGYQVQTSGSYSEAITALDQQTFDLAVIDVNLTGVSGNQDGIRLLERLASQGCQTLTIMISGSKTRAMAEESVADVRPKEFKPIAFVDKTTFDITEFVTMVTGVLS